VIIDHVSEGATVLWLKWGVLIGVVMSLHRGLSGFDGWGVSARIFVSDDVVVALASSIV
jgi:hypothetical protein